VVFLVIVCLALYGMGIGLAGPMETVLIILVIILIMITGFITIRKTRMMRNDLPADDELSRMVSWKAGAYSYFITIFIAVGILWYNTLGVDEFGLPVLDTASIVGIIVLVTGIIYLLLALWFNRKGDVA